MAVHIVNHPLVHDALITLRDKRTPPEAFRRAATRISVLLAAEALRDVPATDVTVETPLLKPGAYLIKAQAANCGWIAIIRPH